MSTTSATHLFPISKFYRNDGEEPEYMATNPTVWLFSSLTACCKSWFGGYAFKSCMGQDGTGNGICNERLYYPDWEGSNESCVDDGKLVIHMLLLLISVFTLR